jgi:abortive infection bacteriophage resistance protein
MPELQTYDKPALSIDEQIDLLIKRGLAVPDRVRAAHYLRYISYYRLSIYARTLQVSGSTEHEFQEGMAFEDVLKLYTFDRELRLLVMDAIERIEVALRGAIAYEFSIEAGPNWYTDETLFKESRYFSHTKEMARIQKLCGKSHEVFMKHHRETYATLPPSWKLVEAMTVGEIERIFFNMDATNQAVKDVRYRIAKSFGIPVRLLLSWFKPICLLRNICAHHGRLWNRKLIYRFDLPRHPNIPWVKHDVGDRQKVYAYLCMVESMMRRINPHSTWRLRLMALLDEHSDIPLADMGFPENWYADEFWSVE